MDTGASAALMGTETFRKLLQEHLLPSGQEVLFGPTKNTFTGIDGEATSASASASTPLGLGWPNLDSISVKVDLLGGKGSKCPGLLLLHVSILLEPYITCGVLPQGDGIMASVISMGNGTIPLGKGKGSAGQSVRPRCYFN